MSARPAVAAEPLRFRWLGVAGVELALAEAVLAIDPFFSRFPLWRLAFGRVRPDPALTAAHLPRCNYVLVSHPHYDHLLDVPEVLTSTGAVAYGSAHTERLLRAQGIPAGQVRVIEPGDRLSIGPFRITVLPGEHGTLLGRPIFSGPLPADLRPPLRARDYRLDRCFSFLIEAGGARILHWGSEQAASAPPADVLFVGPHRPQACLAQLLASVRPRLVVPMHWDDIFRPLARPLRPMLAPPTLTWPPLHRIHLAQFRCAVRAQAPRAEVLVPELFATYPV